MSIMNNIIRKNINPKRHLINVRTALLHIQNHFHNQSRSGLHQELCCCNHVRVIIMIMGMVVTSTSDAILFVHIRGRFCNICAIAFAQRITAL